MGHIKTNQTHEAAMRQFDRMNAAVQTASDKVCVAGNRLCRSIENSNGQIKRALITKEPSHG